MNALIGTTYSSESDPEPEELDRDDLLLFPESESESEEDDDEDDEDENFLLISGFSSSLLSLSSSEYTSLALRTFFFSAFLAASASALACLSFSACSVIKTKAVMILEIGKWGSVGPLTFRKRGPFWGAPNNNEFIQCRTENWREMIYDSIPENL